MRKSVKYRSIFNNIYIIQHIFAMPNVSLEAIARRLGMHMLRGRRADCDETICTELVFYK